MDVGWGAARWRRGWPSAGRSWSPWTPTAIPIGGVEGSRFRHRGDVEQLPFRDGSFQRGQVLDVCQRHFPDDRTALVELSRITADAGDIAPSRFPLSRCCGAGTTSAAGTIGATDARPPSTPPRPQGCAPRTSRTSSPGCSRSCSSSGSPGGACRATRVGGRRPASYARGAAPSVHGSVADACRSAPPCSSSPIRRDAITIFQVPMADGDQLLSVVVPIFNEEETLREFSAAPTPSLTASRSDPSCCSSTTAAATCPQRSSPSWWA